MRPVSLLIASVSLFLTACATSPDSAAPRFAGRAGSVEWEVVDIGRITRPDGMRLRWSYTIVLREKAGSAVQFESLEYGILTHHVATGGFQRSEFYRRLEAGSELRLNTTDSWGWTATANRQFGSTADLDTMLVERRYIGKNAQGQPVVVPVRLALHRGSGRQSRQPASPDPPLPPARLLQAVDDLASLAGRWEGYYQRAGFHVPVAATIGAIGSIEIAENDPVTHRFRGTLILRDGRLTYAGRDTGEFALHQDAARRVLVGRIALAAVGAALPETISVRLEPVSSTAAPAAPASVPSAAASTQPAVSAAVPLSSPTAPSTPRMKIADLSGTYRGSLRYVNASEASIELSVQQEGTSARGSYSTSLGAHGTLTGSIEGTEVMVRLFSQVVSVSCVARGNASDTGQTITGTFHCTDGSSGVVYLVRQ